MVTGVVSIVFIPLKVYMHLCANGALSHLSWGLFTLIVTFLRTVGGPVISVLSKSASDCTERFWTPGGALNIGPVLNLRL